QPFRFQLVQNPGKMLLRQVELRGNDAFLDCERDRSAPAIGTSREPVDQIPNHALRARTQHAVLERLDQVMHTTAQGQYEAAREDRRTLQFLLRSRLRKVHES